ncbi:protein D3-like [Chrysoperla carnea]|uniref:protein D3-like n=1 Tax=Chrysoperla carnea TaxID=189513 RepID=UPI001D093021|nr:protein D3-like [Chrysoperla carnea]
MSTTASSLGNSSYIDVLEVVATEKFIEKPESNIVVKSLNGDDFEIIRNRKKQLLIIYPSGIIVEPGNHLTPTQVLKTPRVKFNGDRNKYYLLVMTDPDAPSRAQPTLREFVHWLVGNIPGDNVCSGETIIEYVPSAPPQNSGDHRYTFLIYEQPGQIEFDEPRISNTSISGRPNFSIRNFANKYGFGEPIFGNFYQCQYDDSVPMIYSMLGVVL